MSSNNVKSLLTDIGRELDGDGLEGEISVESLRCKVRLLNEEESNWRYAHVDSSNSVSALTSYRLPTLAIGIRDIFHQKQNRWISVYEFFDEDWKFLPQDTRDALESMNKYAKKYFVAEHLMEWLSQRPPEVLVELVKQWDQLEARRKEAQEALKKSLGEGSEKEESTNSTELSPSGGC
jgi:hypothetical protein